MPRVAYLSLVIALCLCAPAVAAGLTNGTFESGVLDPWTPGNPDYVGWSISTENPHLGNYCAVGVAGPDCLVGPVGTTQTFDLAPEQFYSASFYYRTQGSKWGSGNVVDIMVYEMDALGNFGAGHRVTVVTAPAANWTRAAVTFTTAPGTVGAFMVFNAYLTQPSTEKFFIDDVRCLAIDPDAIPPNGGFETGILDPWYGNAPSYVNYEVTSDNPHSGDYCAVGTCVTPGAPGGLLQWEFGGLKPNTKYLAKLWYRTAGNKWGSGSVAESTFYEKRADGSFSTGHGLMVVTSVVTNWAMASKTFVTGPDTTKAYLHVNFNGGQANTEKIWIDDVAFVEIDTTQKPWNGGFETGWIDGWTPGGAAATYEATSVNPHSGNYCAVITGKWWAYSNMSQLFDIEPDTEYIASVWYRTQGSSWDPEASPSNVVDNYLQIHDAAGNYVGQRPGLGIITQPAPEWTKLSVVFKSKPEAAQAYWFNALNLAAGDKLFLDDFRLTKVEYLPFDSIGAMKKAGDITHGEFEGVVTRAIDESRFFVESPDRSAGVLVETQDFPLDATPEPGDVYRFKGKTGPALDTDSFYGMMAFQTVATPVPAAVPQVAPLAPLGSILRPLLTGTDPDMEGLFVKVGGMASGVDWATGGFFINDGSGGTVRVGYYQGYPFIEDGDFVAVTGNVVSFHGTKWIYVLPFDQVQFITP